jgi:hypothetical protein
VEGLLRAVLGVAVLGAAQREASPRPGAQRRARVVRRRALVLVAGAAAPAVRASALQGANDRRRIVRAARAHRGRVRHRVVPTIQAAAGPGSERASLVPGQRPRHLIGPPVGVAARTDRRGGARTEVDRRRAVPAAAVRRRVVPRLRAVASPHSERAGRAQLLPPRVDRAPVVLPQVVLRAAARRVHGRRGAAQAAVAPVGVRARVGRRTAIVAVVRSAVARSAVAPRAVARRVAETASPQETGAMLPTAAPTAIAAICPRRLVGVDPGPPRIVSSRVTRGRPFPTTCAPMSLMPRSASRTCAR